MATKIGVEPTVVADVVGRQCESGDLMCQDVALPDPRVGDLVAMPATGAYAYTLANNYNGACKPPVIFCADGSSTLAVARETYEDLLHTQQPALQRRWESVSSLPNLRSPPVCPRTPKGKPVMNSTENRFRPGLKMFSVAALGLALTLAGCSSDEPANAGPGSAGPGHQR